MSDDLVMLTGDRNLGVRLRHMSWDAILSKYEGEQRLRVLHQIEDAPKPDWWPIGAQSYALGKTIRNEDLPQWDTGDEAMRGGPPAEGISVLPDPAESSDLDASQRQGSGKTGASAGPSRPGGAKSNGPTGVVEDLSGTMPRQPGKTPAQGRSGDDLFFRMPVNRAWSPTGFRLRQGTKIIILAGEHAEAAAPADPRATHHRVRPEGVAGKLPRLPYPHLPALSLVGRIGNGPVFAVGGGLQMPVTPEQDGKELSLGINDDNVADNAGHWGIRIAILP
jgi:hypothetical protein